MMLALGIPGPMELMFLLALPVIVITVVLLVNRGKANPPRGFPVEEKKETK
jgi:hypothetical protein